VTSFDLLLDSISYEDAQAMFAQWRAASATPEQITQQFGLTDFLSSIPPKPLPDYEYRKHIQDGHEVDEANSQNKNRNSERNRAFASFKILQKIQGYCQCTDGLCSTCWMTVPCCTCKRLQKEIEQSRARLGGPSSSPAIKFIVVMAFEEFLRASNTGKILLQTHANTELLIMPNPAHVDRLIELGQCSNTIALFPSTSSVTVPEYASSIGASMPHIDPAALRSTLAEHYISESHLNQCNPPVLAASNTTSTENPIPQLNVLLFDATWSQARRLLGYLTKPDGTPIPVPHVRVNPWWPSLFGPLRQQSTADRCCTLEAAILLMQELGLPESEWGPPLQGLKVMVDAVRVQSHSNQVYGTFDAKTVRLMLMRNTLTEKGMQRMAHKRRLATDDEYAAEFERQHGPDQKSEKEQ
jgi:DTW domain-containing protein YfiP